MTALPIRAWDGEVITEPGFVTDLPLGVYHSDVCDGPSASSSNLRQIEAESPAHFWGCSYYNPVGRPREATDAMVIGSAAHHLLLGEEHFAKRFAVRPEEWKDWRTTASKVWRTDQEAAGRQVLTSDALEKIAGMAEALDRHPIAGDLLRGHIETSMFWRDPATGIWLKSRPDAMPGRADDTLADLKCPMGTGGAHPDEVERKLESLGYAMQLGLAAMVWKGLTGRSVTDAVLVSVEQDWPHVVSVVKVGEQTLFRAAQRLRKAIDTFAACWESGDWPGYAGDGRTIGYPAYVENRLQAREEAGELPLISGDVL